jgi:hypothetical protein
MKKIHYFLGFLALLSLGLILSFSRQFWRHIPGFDIKNHHFQLETLPLLMAGIVFCFLLFGLWIGYSETITHFFSPDAKKAFSQDLLSYLPLSILLLLPLTLNHYLDADDLLARVKIFFWSILFALLYLKTASLYHLDKEHRSLLKDLVKKWSSFPLKKKLFLIFLIAFILYNAGSALLVTSGQTFAGDEPHYLLISHSLLKDGDFNLSNNYANKDYQQIMLSEVGIKSHTAPGTGGRYSFHSPGTSLLLLPFYAAGSLFQGKLLVLILRLGMSFFGALLGVQIFLYVFQEWKNEKLAFTVWAVFSFTSPVFFYSLHVYPEIFIALFSLTVFRLLRFSDSFSKAGLVFIGFLLSCFIWFHAIKYVLILIPFFLYALWTLLKKHRVGWNILFFLSFPVILTLVYFLFQYTLYGSFSLSSVSWRGAMTPPESLAYLRTIVTDIPFRIRWETLAGYFLDQRDGLLLYAPVYFFAFLGLVEMIRRNFRHLLLILFLAAPYVLNSALLTQRTGYAPQARPLVSVSWAMAIAIGYFLVHNKKKIFSLLFSFFTFLSFCIVFLLLNNPGALYQLTTFGITNRAGRLYILLSNINFFLPKYLPSYLKIDNTRWIPNYAWAGSLLLFLALYVGLKKHVFRMKFSAHVVFSSIGILVLFLWIVLYPRTVLLDPEYTSFPSGHKITFYSIGRVARMTKPGQFHLPEDSRSYVFYFTSWRKIHAFRIDFGTRAGTFDVDLDIFDMELFRGEIPKKTAALHLPSPPSYRLKKTHLYRISIYLEKTSGLITREKPFVLSILPVNEGASKTEMKGESAT